MRRRLLPLMAVVVTVGAAFSLLQGREPASQMEANRPFVVGSGARSARVLPGRAPRERATVVFLHGWGLSGRRAYAAWLEHLADRGSTVIVPRYQTSLRTPSNTVVDNALAGVRNAIRRLERRPRAVVVVGHSVGGVLAVDYAVRARSAGLPPARAVMAVYPGGALRDSPPVPLDDAASLPSSTRRLVVIASPADAVVGTGPAEAIYAAAAKLAGRRRLIRVEGPTAGGHFAPVLDSAAARRRFWKPLDRLVRLSQ